MVMNANEIASSNNQNTLKRVKDNSAYSSLKQKSKSRSKSKSKSKKRTESYPKEDSKINNETINIVPVNKHQTENKQLKKCESMKRIGSEQRHRGPGSITSNRNNSINSEKDPRHINLASSYLENEEIKAISKPDKKYIGDGVKPRILNQSYDESIQSNDSQIESKKRVVGSIYRGNSAKKLNNTTINIVNNKNNFINNDDPHILRKSADHSKSTLQESPVVIINKELRFEADFSKDGNEEIGDLNELLQLNDYNNKNKELEYSEVENKEITNNKEQFILTRHCEIFNQQRSRPSLSLEGLKSLSEPLIVDNIKIFDPIPSPILKTLTSIPLTALKHLFSTRSYSSSLSSISSLFTSSLNSAPAPLLLALQLRLLKILAKSSVSSLLLSLVSCIYEYQSKLASMRLAEQQLSQTSCISKVRSNKAFEIRRKLHAQGSKLDGKQEAQLQVQLDRKIAQQLLVKICFLVLKLKCKYRKETTALLQILHGTQERKAKAFASLKSLWIGRKQQVDLGKAVRERMRQRKLYLCFKSWQDIKAIKQKRIEKQQKAIDILKRRKTFRAFYYFKIGVVQNRIKYLDDKIVAAVYYRGLKARILAEWGRTVHVEKTIKSKVIKIMSSRTDNSSRFLNMNKLQIDEYFTLIKRELLDRINEDIISLKLERNHYKSFIKNELSLFKSAIENKCQLKIIYKTKTFLDKQNCPNFNENTFTAARNYLCLTPKTFRGNKVNHKSENNDDFVDALKYHSHHSSAERNYSEAQRKYIGDNIDLERSIVEKEKIHRSFHHFKCNRSFSYEMCNKSSNKQSQPMYVQQMSLLESKGLIIHDSPYSRETKESINRYNLNSFPKPLPSRVLTPRGAPNDLFRRLEEKLKSCKGLSSNGESRYENRSISSSIIEKIYDPELKVKEHIRNLILNMRMLRDVPKDYFRKSYFIQNPQIDPKDSINTLEDILREGRRIHPEMKLSDLFGSIHGSKLINLCFTQWKIAFIQNWICKDMRILQKYKYGKLALNAIRSYIKQKKSDVQEFQIKKQLLKKASCFKQWKILRNQPVNRYILNKFFGKWRNAFIKFQKEKAKEFESLLFRDRLLKQKVIYILYRYTQCNLVPKKKYQNSLKTKAMYSLIVHHNQLQKLKKICNRHLDSEKMNTIRLKILDATFVKWKHNYIDNKTKEFGAQALLGIVYSNQYTPESNNIRDLNLVRKVYSQHNSDEIKEAAAKLFRIQKFFSNWRDISISKRIEFPYDYYNKRLYEKSFYVFKLVLRQKWVKQKSKIICQACTQRREDKLKGKIFVKLLEHVYLMKRKRGTKQVADNFRYEMLLSKSYQGFKLNKINKYSDNQIINYCTSNYYQNQINNDDYYESIQNDIKRRYNESASVKVQEDRLSQLGNSHQLQHDSERLNFQDEIDQQNDITEDNDELLENIYERYV